MAGTTLPDADRIIVQLRRITYTTYGARFDTYGEPIRMACSVEEGPDVRYKAIRILAREWPGDLYSTLWWRGDPYEPQRIDEHPHGSRMASHFEIIARRVADHRYDTEGNMKPPEVPAGSRTWGLPF